MFGWWIAFRENLQFTSQHVFLQTLPLVWTLHLCHGVYYLTKHVILDIWVKILDFIQIFYKGGLSNSGFSFPWYKHCVILHTHKCSHDSRVLHLPNKTYQWLHYMDFNFLPWYNLDANKRKEIALSIMKQTNSSGQSCKTATHSNHFCKYHRHKRYKEHLFQWQLKYHITLFILTSAYTIAIQTWMLWHMYSSEVT
jgi:hypothetical protein